MSLVKIFTKNGSVSKWDLGKKCGSLEKRGRRLLQLKGKGEGVDRFGNGGGGGAGRFGNGGRQGSWFQQQPVVRYQKRKIAILVFPAMV